MAPPANAPGSTRGESAIRSPLVRGHPPMNSLGVRTDFMLDCLELLATLTEPTATNAMRDGWLDLPPPLFGRHPDEEEDLEDEDFDDEEEGEDEDFDEED